MPTVATDSSPVIGNLVRLGDSSLLAQTRDGGVYAITVK